MLRVSESGGGGWPHAQRAGHEHGAGFDAHCYAVDSDESGHGHTSAQQYPSANEHSAPADVDGHAH